MKADIDYLRGLADNKNLPKFMRDSLCGAADELHALRKDAARLDWLADKDNPIGIVQLPMECVLNSVHSLRGAIDEAMHFYEGPTDDKG